MDRNKELVRELSIELANLRFKNEKLKEEIEELNRLIDQLREDQFAKLPF